MSERAEGSKKAGEGKKPHKNKPTSKKWEKYSAGKKGKNCPRCGPGIFLAQHVGRMHCGKCGYTEFNKK